MTARDRTFAETVRDRVIARAAIAEQRRQDAEQRREDLTAAIDAAADAESWAYVAGVLEAALAPPPGPAYPTRVQSIEQAIVTLRDAADRAGATTR